MKIFRSLDDLTTHTAPAVLTIGNFDGVHRGHRLVIDNVIARARELSVATGQNVQAIAVTFDPHPIRVLRPEIPVSLITPLAQKLELLAATGLDAAFVIPFTPNFSTQTARAFATHYLRDALHAVEVHEGENFRFGHSAAADINGLTHLGGDLNFAVRAYQPRVLRGAPISSTRIRDLIAEGNMAQTRALLGRPFAIRSTPASGRGYGTRYTVPTINLAPYADLLPANGVYITTLRIGQGPTARTFNGVTNAGNRPTFGVDSFAVESHLLNFEPIALTEDTPLELTFLHRLRGEIRFPTPEALRAQIGQDVRQAQRYFALCSTLT